MEKEKPYTSSTYIPGMERKVKSKVDLRPSEKAFDDIIRIIAKETIVNHLI